jgi:hypothetical protein
MTPQAAESFSLLVNAPPPLSLDFGHGVIVEDHDEIRAYLAKYPEILPWLPDFIAETRKVFGEGARLRLVMNHDPEFYDPFLILRVRPADREPSLPRFHQISEKFDDKLVDSDAWVLVTWDHSPN